jgi:hypothetical protein
VVEWLQQNGSRWLLEWLAGATRARPVIPKKNERVLRPDVHSSLHGFLGFLVLTAEQDTVKTGNRI